METNDDVKSESGERRFQFSIRRILVFTALAAAVLALGRYWPHVVIFVVISAATVWVTIRLAAAVFRRKKKHALLWVPVFLAAWFVCYVASIGPALWALRKAQQSDPYSYSSSGTIQTLNKIYGPATWFFVSTGLSEYIAGPFDSYVNAWLDMAEQEPE